VDVIMWSDDGCETTIKMNDRGRWSINGVVFWLGKR
jgi:hypothetical protein